MRSLEEALDLVAYHPATPDTAPKHAAVRDLLAAFITDLWPLIPDGPDKTTAIRRVWEAGTYANLAIARTAPVDVSETRGVARELPEDKPLPPAAGQTNYLIGLVNSFLGEDAEPKAIAEQLQAGLDYLRRRR